MIGNDGKVRGGRIVPTETDTGALDSEDAAGPRMPGGAVSDAKEAVVTSNEAVNSMCAECQRQTRNAELLQQQYCYPSMPGSSPSTVVSANSPGHSAPGIFDWHGVYIGGGESQECHILSPAVLLSQRVFRHGLLTQ